MPTYPYACTSCEHSFEIVQSFSEDALTECPECGGGLRKLYSSVGIVFKGSGFYRTDSRTDGKSSTSAAASTSSTTSATTSKSEGSTSSPATTSSSTPSTSTAAPSAS
ncbi:MAG: FmdB family transcriptional regulator [Actinobacteria bacterium]|nr:FmdB family transcriptional regulator [Actinomycetota bacterium]MTB25223.1 FmdB family transcriptional regulator [Actinomycetota bacterium]